MSHSAIGNREARLGYRTWIELDQKAIEHNYKVFRSIIDPKTKLMSVVKSNAYGHGLVDFSKKVTELGVDWLAVDSIVEALRLRQEGITVPILVLGYTLPERMQEAIDTDISITISSLFALQGLKELNLKGKLNVHIKIDSGMHRQGFMVHEREQVMHVLKDHSDELEIEGLYTHFAAAKDPALPGETMQQVAVFKIWIEALKTAGHSPIIHAAATGATLLFKETHFDMVRVGIGMHGLWPSKEVQDYLQKKMPLKPSLAWKTIIGELKTIPAGSRIGYDFTEEVHRETKVAICPIGYWHGYNRSLSSMGVVLVHGVKAKILGRVSMDMIMIDVTDVPKTAIGDEVVLIGHSEEAYLGAHEVAGLAGVSTYEFITRINPLIKKIYI
jgi:alanine racemase